MSGEHDPILTPEEAESMASVGRCGPLLDSHEALRGERDAAREALRVDTIIDRVTAVLASRRVCSDPCPFIDEGWGCDCFGDAAEIAAVLAGTTEPPKEQNGEA